MCGRPRSVGDTRRMQMLRHGGWNFVACREAPGAARLMPARASELGRGPRDACPTTVVVNCGLHNDGGQNLERKHGKIEQFLRRRPSSHIVGQWRRLGRWSPTDPSHRFPALRELRGLAAGAGGVAKAVSRLSSAAMCFPLAGVGMREHASPVPAAYGLRIRPALPAPPPTRAQPPARRQIPPAP